jgi:hypothetical protein
MDASRAVTKPRKYEKPLPIFYETFDAYDARFSPAKTNAPAPLADKTRRLSRDKRK